MSLAIIKFEYIVFARDSRIMDWIVVLLCTLEVLVLQFLHIYPLCSFLIHMRYLPVFNLYIEITSSIFEVAEFKLRI